jgi:cobalt-zinc-cadmium efflux system outer membrane protein
VRSWLPLAVAAAACAPSRQELFDPVARDVHARTGARVTWRGGEGRPPEVERAIDRLLARPLDADAAARVALLARPAVQAAFEELGASAADLAGAVAPARAEAELELRTETGSGDQSELELAVVTDLLDLATLPGRRGAARAGIEAARARATRTAIDVAAEARIALYRTAAAEQVLAMRRSAHEASAASTELARRLRAAGNTTALALAQEEALAEQTQLDLAGAEAAHDEAREALAAALGLAAADTRMRAMEELPDPPPLPPDLAQLDAVAIDRSLELGALRWRGEAAARRLGVARWRSFLPELGAGASAQRSSESGWSVGPALRLSIPLLDWGQGERGRAASELRRARRLHEDGAIRLRAAARTAARRLVAARERAIRLRDVLVPLRARIADETLLQYNAMRATPFELVAARQAQIDARRQYVEALRDTWIAAAEVDRLRAGGTATAPGAPRTSDTEVEE